MLEAISAIALLCLGAMIELLLSYIAVTISNKVVDHQFAIRNSGENL